MRLLARNEAKSCIDEEIERRLNEVTARTMFARKMVTKKTHQIIINELLKVK